MRSSLASHTHLNLLSLFFVLDLDLGAQLHIPARRDGHLDFTATGVITLQRGETNLHVCRPTQPQTLSSRPDLFDSLAAVI